MDLSLSEDGAVRGRFPFVVVWFDIVLAHGVVFKLVPHEDAAEIGVIGEEDAEEIEDFAFLELA